MVRRRVNACYVPGGDGTAVLPITNKRTEAYVATKPSCCSVPLGRGIGGDRYTASQMLSATQTRRVGLLSARKDDSVGQPDKRS